jgi:Flp pilus assembly protein TadG
MKLANTLARLCAPIVNLGKKAREDRDGVIAIITALLGAVLIGGSALAVDVSYWRYREEMLQSAADAVAASAVYDLTNGVTSSATLSQNATYEAARNGCNSNCTVAVVWPYNGSNSEVQVTLTDASAKRFFSFLYDSSAKTLDGRSVAAVGSSSSSSTSSTPRFDTACVLALNGSASQSVEAYNGASPSNPNGVQNPNCEVIANSNSSSAIDIENNSEIAGKATTAGQILQRNNWTYIGVANPGAAVVSDPYASIVSLPSSSAGACSDPISGQAQPLNISGSSGPGTNGNTETQPLNKFTLVGGTTWSVTGGGHWCKGWSISGITLNMGPGTYIIDSNMNLSSSTINATGSGGATIVYGAVGGNFNSNINSSTINIIAPPQGATVGIPGIVLMNYTDDSGGRQIYVNSNSFINFTGTVYFPKNNLYVQSGAGLNAIQNSNGCGHIIVSMLNLQNYVSVGNNCTLAQGVQPFGTGVSSPAWGGTTSGGSSTTTTVKPVFLQ